MLIKNQNNNTHAQCTSLLTQKTLKYLYSLSKHTQREQMCPKLKDSELIDLTCSTAIACMVFKVIVINNVTQRHEC